MWSISVMTNNVTLPSADYEVSADVIWSGSNPTQMQYLGVIGRAEGNWNRYAAYYDPATQQWKLDARKDNTSNIIGTFNQAYTQGQTRNVRLKMTGATITVYVDNVAVINATNAALTAAGDPGIITGALSDPSQMLIDNFLVRN